MAHKILEEAQEMNDLLIKWRRDLHQIPETDLELPKTVEYISKRLDEMNVEYKVFPEVSVIIAQIGKGDKCFLLRSDMDALPVEEETGLEFASKNSCMHGCGHDLHATILLGAAKILKAHEEELPGVVKLLFQPGEETFRGAKAAVEAGVLENPHVDAAFAAHVFAAIPYGTIGYGVEAMASVYGFKITLTGRGGHGSAPEGCIDPINAGVEVYHALQALIARECPPSAEAALTIGQFTAGNAANVIPERCVLQGTLRTFNEEVRTMLIRRINEIVPAVAAAYRTTCEIEELSNEFPGLDCGSCGAPSCRALAEDIVRGKAEKNDCVYILRNHIHLLSETYSRFSHEAIVDGEDPNACIHILMHYMDKLTEEIALLDSHNLINSDTESEEGQDHDH